MKPRYRVTLTALAPLTLVLCTLNTDLVAQEETGPADLAGKTTLGPAFRYQYLPDNWSIDYFGLSLEYYVSETISASGSVLYGSDRRDDLYVHFPGAGLAVFALFAWLNRGDGSWITSDLLKLLIVENIHYNIRTGGKVVLAPFVSLLGADLRSGEEGDEGSGLYSFGGGLQIKALLSRHFMLSSHVGLKYFVIGDKIRFGSGNQFGTTIGLNLGVVF